MKPGFARCSIVLLFLAAGFGSNLIAQCVTDEEVYSFNYNSHAYEVIQSLKTWTEAASCAVERGGYLVEINSQAEQDTIYHAIIDGAGVPVDYSTVTTGGGIAYVWIGASDQATEGTWLWDGDGDNTGTNFWNGQGSNGLGDGAPVDGLYNNWGGTSSGSPNEPDDYLNAQDGGAIGLSKWPAGVDFTLGIASEWNDISPDNNLYFVVEYDCTETIDTLVTQEDNILTAHSAGAAYQWLDCNNGHAVIEGETDQSFSPAASGSYAVEITIHGCKDTSGCHAIDPVVGFEGRFKGHITAIQGSGNNEIYVELGNEYQEITVNVSDLNGRTVHSEAFSRSRDFQFVLDMPPGIYFISVRSGNEQAVIKLMKR